MIVDSSQLIRCLDLSHDEQNALDSLVVQWRAKLRRNNLRAAYYDGRNARIELGISTPPVFKRIETVLGWSAKAVDVLNRRCKLEGFRVADSLGDVGVQELWDANHLAVEAPQAQVSSLIHATSFLVATRGDESAGEPAALITARSATSSTGLWDLRARTLTSFLSITAVDDMGEPTELALYLPDLIVLMAKTAGSWTVTDRRAHSYGVPVEPLVYQPRLGRPFGSSRISRAIMSIQNSALRTIVRSEVSAEMYSIPQRVLLGADESAFMDANGNPRGQWQSLLGRIWAVGRDEDGELPEMKEFSAASQQPHMDQLRSWAQLFAGESSIPLASLGIAGDANPTSGEAYEAGRADLVAEAEGATDGWSLAWRRTMLRALAIRAGVPKVSDEVAAGVTPKWRNPAYISRAAAADAASKMLNDFPWLRETTLGLELYGLDSDFIERAGQQLKRQGAQDRLRELVDAVKVRRDGVEAAGGDVQVEPVGGRGVGAR